MHVPNSVAVKRTNRRNMTPYLFLLPYFMGLILFSVFPIFFSLYISFTSWNGFGAFQYVGLDNYERLLFQDTRLYKTFYNTAFIMFITIPVNISLALIMSYVLNSKLTVFKRFFQTASFLPYITIPVAVGMIWAMLFDRNFGIINYAALSLHIIEEPVYWLGEALTARIVLAIVLVWKYYGYLVVLFLAGMSVIPEELYEAAMMDGAGALSKFFRITLPMIKNVIIFVVITSIIGGFQMFDEPYLLFKGGLSGGQPFGGPDQAGLTMSMFFYDTSFNVLDFGYGAAISYAMFVVIAIFSLSIMKLMVRKEG